MDEVSGKIRKTIRWGQIRADGYSADKYQTESFLIDLIRGVPTFMHSLSDVHFTLFFLSYFFM